MRASRRSGSTSSDGVMTSRASGLAESIVAVLPQMLTRLSVGRVANPLPLILSTRPPARLLAGTWASLSMTKPTCTVGR
eukprot:scaffold54828_cov30-Tisochrysis_lutea.AAC.14